MLVTVTLTRSDICRVAGEKAVEQFDCVKKYCKNEAYVAFDRGMKMRKDPTYGLTNIDNKDTTFEITVSIERLDELFDTKERG